MEVFQITDIQRVLDLAQASGLYTPAQLELIRERCADGSWRDT